ncbi:LRRF1 protein, partial [Crocuta crocuta]
QGSRGLPGLSAATLASLGGTSSRRGSGDTSISMDTEASIREIKELNELKDQIQDVEGKYMQGLKEMKDSLAEVEEKYKKAMVSNAQLDNEKTNFMYQVDTLKDTLLELEEQLAESRRQYEEKSKEFEREKHAHSILQFQFAEVKEALKQREEMLEKHGIVLNSEITTNGETSDSLNSIGHQGPTKITKEELNALKTMSDGTLGKASEVEVKSEIVENVGRKGILQNTEQEQHKEDPARERVDTEVSHPGGNAEGQKASEDRAPSPGVLADGPDEEQVQNQSPENAPFLENTEQVEFSEAINTPDNRTGASLERSSCAGELDGGSPTEGVVEAGLTGLGEQVGTVASGPPRDSGDAVSDDEKHAVDTPTELDPSSGHDLEKETTMQGIVEPKELPVESTAVDWESDEKEDQERGLRDEKPIQTEVQNIPCCPAAKSSPQGATGPSVADTDSKPLDTKEPEEEKNDQQGEALDSSQKKTKNKKKKNKKKKPPTPVETLKDVKKELTFQNPDLSEGKEEEQVKLTDEKAAVESQVEVPESPEKESAAGSSENVDGPENSKIELDEKLNQEDNDVNTKAGKEAADGDTLAPGDDTTQSSGASADNKEPDEATIRDEANEDGATHSVPEPESGDEDGASHSVPDPGSGEASGGTLLENGSPLEDIDDASQTGSREHQEVTECPGEVVGNVVENEDDLAPTGELGASDSDQPRGRSEKGKSKEDCTLS